MKTTHSWRNGYRGGKVPAEAAARELERIERHYQGLRPEEIVKEAAPVGAVLHPEFEWDDSKAATQHRLEQARRLIRAVVVTVEERPPRRVYTYIPSDGDGLYRRTEVAAKHDDLRMAALLHLRHQVSEAEQALREFKDACEIHGADEQTMARLLIAAEMAAGLRSVVDSLN